MAIDTQEKRMAASGVGRPFMRGKLPGSNDQEWRIASGNGYGGNSLAAVTVPDQPGLEFTIPVNRMHYTMPTDRLHHTVPVNRLHFTMAEED